MSSSDPVLRGRLKWLMFLRVVVATFLLGATVLLQLRETRSLLIPPLLGLYGLVASIFLLTLLYAFLIKRVNNVKALAYGQIAGDVALETALVYLTGSEESIFSSIYNLSIITGSILLYRQGGIMTASLSGLLYGGLLNLRYYAVLPSLSWVAARPTDGAGSEIFYTILINLSAFFLVAFLSSYLAEQARISQRELEVTQSDLSKLTAIHENILQCLHSGLLTTDLHGRIVFANQAALEILGVPFTGIFQRPLPELFLDLPLEILRDTPEGPIPLEDRRKTMSYQRPDGEGIYLGFSLAPLRSADGERIGTITHFQDLTRTIAMEEHLRRVDRLATIGELAARIAHEIRNPLASLSGSIQILQKELRLDGPNRRLMEIVTRETRRLNGLLTDFLVFAKPEQLRVQEMDIAKALQETLELFMEREREGPPVQVITEIAPQLRIQADPKRMRELFWNLLNNALEAMPQGGKLWVRARWSHPAMNPPKGDGTLSVLFEVEDTGVGIPAEIRDRVFDPFFTTKDKGTGLGLSMVHRSMEDVGGRIEVRSEVGKGTRFSLWIPSRPAGQLGVGRTPRLDGGIAGAHGREVTG